jgi:cell division septation protein DedD
MEARPDIIRVETKFSASEEPVEIDRPATANRPSGKNSQFLDAIAATGGATLVELVALTGWQAHTTRAALTRLRQRGFSVYLETDGDRKAYRAAHVARVCPG